MKTHQNGAVPDLRRAVGRRLCIALAAQSVYAMELYLFFFRPDMVWNKMLVMLECIFLLPCLRTLFSRF